MPTKTVNRGMLLRRAKSGKLLAKCNYRYTDDYAYDAASNFGEMDEYLPVRIVEPGNTPREEGFVYFWEWHFKGYGRAWKDDNSGVITLMVHSNLCYTLKIEE